MSTKRREFLFGPFVLDADARVLYRAGDIVPLTPKALDTLLVLAQAAGHVVDKDELIKRVWPDTFVEEGSLTRNISAIRHALGGGAGWVDDTTYIETVPKRGYRFAVAAVSTGSIQQGVTDEPSADAASGAKAPDWPRWFAWVRVGRPPLWRAAVLVGMVALAVAVALWFGRGAGARADTAVSGSVSGAISAVAVEPFRVIGMTGDADALGAGMADVLVTRLERMSRASSRPLRVVQLESAPNRDSLDVARRLGIDVLVDASVQRDGDRIRVTARLLRVGDGSPLWADTLDDRFVDVFALQDSISRRIGEALLLRISDDSGTGGRHPRYGTASVEAYEHYLRGRYLWSRHSLDDASRAMREFEAALALDNTYAEARVGIADCYLQALESGVRATAESLKRAESTALEALTLDAGLADAHVTLARVKSLMWRWADADAEFKVALSIDSGQARTHQMYAASVLIPLGRVNEAIGEFRRALETDPLSVSIGSNLGAAFHYARRYDEAIAQHRKTLALEPDFEPAHYDLGMSYEQAGQFDQAEAEFNKALKQPSIEPVVLACLAHAQAAAGRQADATRTVRKLNAIARQRDVSPYLLALVDLGFQRYDQAIAHLKQAYAERFPFVPWINVDPRFDPIRQDRRFIDLLRRVGIADQLAPSR
jgi:DNA-binding winged helix-turn-helix (wHTH) protein/TolB-like protein/tetratricopeptide (TPR) repeat protein